MEILIVVIVVAIAAIAIPFIWRVIIKSITGTTRGLRYGKIYEEEYASLVTNGYSNEEALLEVSKKARPEMAPATHVEIVRRYTDIHRLVTFHVDALGVSDRLNDDIAIQILRNTRMEHVGGNAYKCRTNWSKVERK